MTDVLRTLDTYNNAVGIPLIADYLLLYFQIALLIALILSQFMRRRDRNLYALILALTSLLLVQGQALWAFSLLQDNTVIVHYRQIISLDGARAANVYFAIATALMVATYAFIRTRDLSVGRQASIPVAGPLTQTSVALVMILAAVGLIALLGGIKNTFTTPGAIVPGQVVFLVMIGMASLPVLDQIAAGQAVSKAAVALFATAFVLILFNSRELAILMLVQVLLVWNYRRRQISARAMAVGVAVALVVVIPYGIYRDFSNYFAGQPALDPVSWDIYVKNRASTGMLDWFYRWNDESFVGLGGILTAQYSFGGITHDFGFSELRIFTDVLPHWIRANPSLPFGDWATFFEDAYPYHGSIIAPGYEAVYAHVGAFGVFAWGVVLGALARRFHIQLQRARDPLMFLLPSATLPLLIRGRLDNAAFFALMGFASVVVYRYIASREARAAQTASIATSST